MCCTHTLISSAAHKHQSLLKSLWLLTSEHLIKTNCLIWPAEGVKLWRREALHKCVGWCEYEAAYQAPPFAFPNFPSCMSLIRLSGLHHVTRKRGSPPFPLLTERKYSNRGGRRWALLRRQLKITGIFKAAEESQGRQRLDSLSPGRSSLLLLSLILARFSLLLLLSVHQTCNMTTTTTPHLNHIFLCQRKPTTDLNDVMKLSVASPQLSAASEAWLGQSKQEAPLTQTSSIYI